MYYKAGWRTSEPSKRFAEALPRLRGGEFIGLASRLVFRYSKGMESNHSLKVIRLEWGEVELEDGSIFKDVKIFPGGARSWEWGETGTHHRPGIQLADVEELLENGTEAIVLTRGVLGRLGVPDELVAQLKQRGVEVHAANTPQAVEIYNQLCDMKRAGILLHSTC